MPTTLTSEAKKDLLYLLDDFGLQGNLPGNLELQSRLIEWAENAMRPSFSELILKNNMAQKTCAECNQLCVTYKYKFRKVWVKCLKKARNICEERGDFTTKDLATELAAEMQWMKAASIVRMFLTVRHWGLIEKTDNTRNGCNAWKITQEGIDFLKGDAAVREHLWVASRGIEFDQSLLPQAPSVTINHIAPDDYDKLRNASYHVENSLPTHL